MNASAPDSLPLFCELGWHRPEKLARWNDGYYFSRCTRCGRDLVRTAYGNWQVPRGYRVVWQASPPESHVQIELVPERQLEHVGAGAERRDEAPVAAVPLHDPPPEAPVSETEHLPSESSDPVAESEQPETIPSPSVAGDVAPKFEDTPTALPMAGILPHPEAPFAQSENGSATHAPRQAAGLEIGRIVEAMLPDGTSPQSAPDPQEEGTAPDLTDSQSEAHVETEPRADSLGEAEPVPASGTDVVLEEEPIAQPAAANELPIAEVIRHLKETEESWDQREQAATETGPSEPLQAPELPLDEPRLDQAHLEEPHLEEPHLEEPHPEDPHLEEPRFEEPRIEEPRIEEPTADEASISIASDDLDELPPAEDLQLDEEPPRPEFASVDLPAPSPDAEDAPPAVVETSDPSALPAEEAARPKEVVRHFSDFDFMAEEEEDPIGSFWQTTDGPTRASGPERLPAQSPPSSVLRDDVPGDDPRPDDVDPPTETRTKLGFDGQSEHLASAVPAAPFAEDRGESESTSYDPLDDVGRPGPGQTHEDTIPAFRSSTGHTESMEAATGPADVAFGAAGHETVYDERHEAAPGTTEEASRQAHSTETDPPETPAHRAAPPRATLAALVSIAVVVLVILFAGRAGSGPDPSSAPSARPVVTEQSGQPQPPRPLSADSLATADLANRRPEPPSAAPLAPLIAGSGQTAFVTASVLQCRSAPIERSDPVRKLVRGAEVQILGREGRWSSIAHRGRQCWAASRFLSAVQPW